MLECWNVGVLECWSVGVLECWSVGVLECWSVGVLECWNVRTFFTLHSSLFPNKMVILNRTTKSTLLSRKSTVRHLPTPHCQLPPPQATVYPQVPLGVDGLSGRSATKAGLAEEDFAHLGWFPSSPV